MQLTDALPEAGDPETPDLGGWMAGAEIVKGRPQEATFSIRLGLA